MWRTLLFGLRNANARRNRCSRTPRRQALRRPNIEQLEDRCVPSVTLLDDFVGRALVDAPRQPVAPPDTHLAVGPNHVVEVVNTHVSFFNKHSGAEVFSQSLDQFFAPAGAPERDPPNGVGVGVDPKVAYDEVDGRFVITALERNLPGQTSHLLIAVSDDANPAGNWEMHRINAEDADKYWADWTALGWDADGYYVTVNMFSWEQIYYHHLSVFSFDKSSLLDGDTGTLTYFDVDRNAVHFTMWPALMHGSEPGDPMYFVENGSDSKILVTRMTDKLTANPTFTDFGIKVPKYDVPPNPSQPGGGDFHITNIGTRILSAAWRNDQLVTSHHVGSDGLARARWYELDTGGARPILVQSGEIDPGPDVHTYLPSIDIAPNGDLGMTYVQSSTDTGDANGDGFADGFLSVFATGRKASDPLGTMQTPLLVKAGEATYSTQVFDPPPYRVGDFSGTVIDPVDGTFWAANEYTTSATPTDPTRPFGNWGTWIANFAITDEGPSALSASAGAGEGVAAAEGLSAMVTRPFQASFTSALAEFVPDPDDPFTFHATGTGRGSHLGQFTLTSTIVFSPDFTTFTGVTILIAANGDRLVIETTGTDTGQSATGGYTISDGTGRFADASGGGDFSIVLNADGSRTATLDGTISYDAGRIAEEKTADTEPLDLFFTRSCSAHLNPRDRLVGNWWKCSI